MDASPKNNNNKTLISLTISYSAARGFESVGELENGNIVVCRNGRFQHKDGKVVYFFSCTEAESLLRCHIHQRVRFFFEENNEWFGILEKITREYLEKNPEKQAVATLVNLFGYEVEEKNIIDFTV